MRLQILICLFCSTKFTFTLLDLSAFKVRMVLPTFFYKYHYINILLQFESKVLNAEEEEKGLEMENLMALQSP